MNVWIQRLSMAGLLLLGGTLRVVAADELEEARSAYRKGMETIEEKHGKAVEQGRERYGSLLERMIDGLRERGDLDGLLAAMKEQERFRAEGRPLPVLAEAELPETLRTAQSEWREYLEKAKLQRNRNVARLSEMYVRRLESIKKKLTTEGRIDEAVAVSREIDRASFSAEAAAADVAESRHEPEPKTEWQACRSCGGTGRDNVPCARCRGNGVCKSCKGVGKRPSGLKGSRNVLACLGCKGSGQCRFCEGTGKADQKCPKCGGTGRRLVARAAPPAPGPRLTEPRRPAPSVGRPRPPAVAVKPAPPAGSGTSIREELDMYTTAKTALYGLYTGGQIKEMALADVVSAPRKYRGLVLASEAYVVSAHPRQVRVRLDRHGRPGKSIVFLPYTIDIGTSAEEVLGKVGSGGRATLTYGVVSRDDFTLFDIRP